MLILKEYCDPYSLVKIAFLVMSILTCSEMQAQLDSIHYFPPIHSRQNGQISDHYVYLSTPEITPFLVTLEDGAGNFIGSATISQDAPQNIFIGDGQVPGTDVAVPMDSLGIKLEASGFKAMADYPFYCNVRVRAPFQATSVACKGLAALGREFYAGSMPQIVSNSNRNFVTSIMAIEDGTIVTVADYDPGVIFEAPGADITADGLTIFLDQGETFILSGYTTTTLANMDGFIGARITSNEDIVVNTGNYMGSIHPGGTQDAGMVQIVPTDILGTDHAVVAGGGGDELERPLVVAIEDGTEIFINDIVAPVATINEGEYYLVPGSYFGGTLHENIAVRTSVPAYVYQATAATTDEATSEFNFIPPLACYLSTGIDAIPDIDQIGASSYDGKLYIVTVAGATVTVNDVTLGGATGPEPVLGLTGWETYKLDVTGSITVESTEAMAAGFISVNGFAGAGAYYAGFNFEFQVDAGLDADLCLGDTITLTGESEVPDVTFIWDGGITDGVPFVPTETTVFTVSGTDMEGCEDNDEILVQVFTIPESDAGPDQSLCDTSITSLLGLEPPETGAGLWTFFSGPDSVTFENETDSFTEVNDLIEGTYELVWTVNNGPCNEATDTVIINVFDQPVSDAGLDQNLCNEYATVLNGNPPLGTASGEWSILSGPSDPVFADIFDPSTALTDLDEGSYELLWTLSNGPCLIAIDTTVINVYNEPTSNAGADQELCATYSVELEGSVAEGTATGIWDLLSGPSTPTFDDATDPYTVVSALEEGTYELIWSVSNGTCPVAVDTVTLAIYDMPVSNAGEDIHICDTAAWNLNALVPAGTSTGEWNFISGPTTPVITEITNPSSTITDLSIGYYLFEWIVSNGNCESAHDTISITINPFPDIDITSSTTFGCSPIDISFTNLSTPLGDDCLWEFGDGTSATDCGDVMHTFEDGIFDITLTVTANGCTSSRTFEDYVEVIPYPTAGFNPSPNVIHLSNTNVKFYNYSKDGTLYKWNFGDGSPLSGEEEPDHKYPEWIEEVYDIELIVENKFGCTDTAYGQIAYQEQLIFYVPNAFTPGDGGFNDDFQPVFTARIDFNYFDMKIFNRWGELLYETTDPESGWNGFYNGALVEGGVYVWQITFKDLFTDEVYQYRGHVTLIR